MDLISYTSVVILALGVLAGMLDCTSPRKPEIYGSDPSSIVWLTALNKHLAAPNRAGLFILAALVLVAWVHASAVARKEEEHETELARSRQQVVSNGELLRAIEDLASSARDAAEQAQHASQEASGLASGVLNFVSVTAHIEDYQSAVDALGALVPRIAAEIDELIAFSSAPFEEPLAWPNESDLPLAAGELVAISRKMDSVGRDLASNKTISDYTSDEWFYSFLFNGDPRRIPIPELVWTGLNSVDAEHPDKSEWARAENPSAYSIIEEHVKFDFSNSDSRMYYVESFPGLIGSAALLRGAAEFLLQGSIDSRGWSNSEEEYPMRKYSEVRDFLIDLEVEVQAGFDAIRRRSASSSLFLDSLEPAHELGD